MKKSILLVLALISMPLFAEVKTYKNDQGCKLVVKHTQQEVNYTLTKAGLSEVVRFSVDYMSVDFSYCPDKSGEVFLTEGSAGSRLMVFCEEDRAATSRGIIDLEIKSCGVVNSFSVTSEDKNDKENGLQLKNFLAEILLSNIDSFRFRRRIKLSSI